MFSEEVHLSHRWVTKAKQLEHFHLSYGYLTIYLVSYLTNSYVCRCSSKKLEDHITLNWIYEFKPQLMLTKL